MINRFALSFLCIELDRNVRTGVMLVYILLALSMEAGVDPTNFRLAAYLLVNSANIIYGCLHTRIETTFCRLSALCNWVTKETLLFNGRSHTRREVRLSIVWACIV